MVSETWRVRKANIERHSVRRFFLQFLHRKDDDLKNRFLQTEDRKKKFFLQFAVLCFPVIKNYILYSYEFGPLSLLFLLKKFSLKDELMRVILRQ